MDHKAETLAKLEAAMERLLGGQQRRTDGALTFSNLAREADVSRATLNRATPLKELWSARVNEAAKVSGASLARADEISKLQAELQDRKRAESATIKELRLAVDVLAQHIQVLTLENARLRAAVGELPDSNVTPIMTTSRIG